LEKTIREEERAKTHQDSQNPRATTLSLLLAAAEVFQSWLYRAVGPTRIGNKINNGTKGEVSQPATYGLRPAFINDTHFIVSRNGILEENKSDDEKLQETEKKSRQPSRNFFCTCLKKNCI
jgi:hypothetical protein